MTRRQRLGRRLRPRQAGLTLVELLLAIALTIVIAGFVLQGIGIARHAFQRDGLAEAALHADGAVQAAGALIEAALPVPILAKGAKNPTVAFEGQSDALHFIALGNGFAFRGGLIAVTIRRAGDDLVADAAPVREGEAVPAAGAENSRAVVLLSHVSAVRLGYFGHGGPAAAGWQDAWRDADTLPELVALTVDTAGDIPGQYRITVPLRQR